MTDAVIPKILCPTYIINGADIYKSRLYKSYTYGGDEYS